MLRQTYLYSEKYFDSLVSGNVFQGPIKWIWNEQRIRRWPDQWSANAFICFCYLGCGICNDVFFIRCGVFGMLDGSWYVGFCIWCIFSHQYCSRSSGGWEDGLISQSLYLGQSSCLSRHDGYTWISTEICITHFPNIHIYTYMQMWALRQNKRCDRHMNDQTTFYNSCMISILILFMPNCHYAQFTIWGIW